MRLRAPLVPLSVPMLSSQTAVFTCETVFFCEAVTPEALTSAAQSGLMYQDAPANGFERCGPGGGVLVGVFVTAGVLVGVFVATGVFVGVFVATGVFVGVFVTAGVLVGVFVAT